MGMGMGLRPAPVGAAAPNPAAQKYEKALFLQMKAPLISRDFF